MNQRVTLRLLVAGFAALVTAGPIAAQVVQLPSFHTFSWSGSVWAPDAGTGPPSSVRRSSSGSSEFGIPFRTGLAGGSERGAAGVAVSAQNHDFPAMEPALANQAANLRGASAADGRAHSLVDDAVPGVAEIRRRQAAELEAQQVEARDYWRRGQQAQAEGKPAVAAVFYRMASRQATGELADRIRESAKSMRARTNTSAPAATKDRASSAAR